MRSPLAVTAVVVVALFAAVFAYEFHLGLGHYAPFAYGDTVAVIVAVPIPADPPLADLGIRAAPSMDVSVPLAVTMRREPVTLTFDSLHQGPIGGLLGVTTATKLSILDYVNRDGTAVRYPVNGGTDLCFQLLELSGGLGALVAAVRHDSVTLPAIDGRWSCDVVQSADGLAYHPRP